jgi:hypothetical protein
MHLLLFMTTSFLMCLYCQDITTEHTEKIFYFIKLPDLLLPPLCVLSIGILRTLTSPLLHYQVPARPSGNKKNETFRIKELPRIQDKKSFISRIQDFI